MYLCIFRFLGDAVAAADAGGVAVAAASAAAAAARAAPGVAPEPAPAATAVDEDCMRVCATASSSCSTINTVQDVVNAEAEKAKAPETLSLPY